MGNVLATQPGSAIRTPGCTRPTRAKRFVTTNPANGAPIGEVPYADGRDVDAAVRAARAAAAEWSRVPIRERARCLELMAEAISRDAEALAVLDTYDSGNVIRGMRSDVQWTIDAIRYFANLIPELKGETFSQAPGHVNFTRRQPRALACSMSQSLWPTSLVTCPPKEVPCREMGRKPCS